MNEQSRAGSAPPPSMPGRGPGPRRSPSRPNIAAQVVRLNDHLDELLQEYVEGDDTPPPRSPPKAAA